MKFGVRLKERGLEHGKNRSQRLWMGIALREEHHPNPPGQKELWDTLLPSLNSESDEFLERLLA